MSRVAVGRLLLGAAGVALGTIGAVELVDAVRTHGHAVGIGIRWLSGPVLLDLALVPLAALVAVLLRRRLPAAWFRPVAAAAAVSLLLTVVAIPFVAGAGRRADNPSLLDRPYLAGWLGLLALVWAAAIVAGLRGRSASAAGSG